VVRVASKVGLGYVRKGRKSGLMRDQNDGTNSYAFVAEIFDREKTNAT